MTGDTVINRAWDMVGDVDTSIQMKRYKLADMVGYLNDAIQNLLSRRPELLLTTSGTLNTFTEITTATYNTATLPVDETYREFLAHYIASRIFESDSDDENNITMHEHHMGIYLKNT